MESMLLKFLSPSKPFIFNVDAPEVGNFGPSNTKTQKIGLYIKNVWELE